MRRDEVISIRVGWVSGQTPRRRKAQGNADRGENSYDVLDLAIRRNPSFQS